MAYGTQVKDLSLVIVQGGGPTLLGRDWLGHVKLDHTVDQLKLEKTLQRYLEVFRDELGTAKTPVVSLTVKDQTQPRFVQAARYPLPLSRPLAGRLIDNHFATTNS